MKPLIGSGADGLGPAFAERTAALLREVTDPAIEIGPGFTALEGFLEEPAGEGPLAALAAGASDLARRGWAGPAIVIASDLPRLEPQVLAWLAAHPSDITVVPLVEGRPQYLCARYDHSTLQAAVALASRGVRSLHELLSGSPHRLATPQEWQVAGVGAHMFTDVDTPDDLAGYRARMTAEQHRRAI